MPNPIISYTQDLSCLSQPFLDEFAARLPLTNLEFVNPLQTELHIIKSLHLELKKYSADLFPKFMPGAVQYNLNFVHVFLVYVEVLRFIFKR